MEIFDVSKLFNAIKESAKKRSLAMIAKDPLMGEDNIQDHNNIEALLLTKYSLKTFKVVVIILNLSYYLGLIWLLICDYNFMVFTAYYKNLASIG